MCNSNWSPLVLIAAALMLGGSPSAQTMVERRVYVGQKFGVERLNAPGSNYDIAQNAATLRLALFAVGSTPDVNNSGRTSTAAIGSIHAGFLGRVHELLYVSGSARSEPRLVNVSGYYRNTFVPITNVFLRTLGNTYQHSDSLSRSTSSPISFFEQTWFFMAGPVPITIYGEVLGTFSLGVNASVAPWTRVTSVSATHMARAWGNSSGQVGIPGAGIGLEQDIELASPLYATISAETTPGTTNSMGRTLTAGSIGGTFRMTMYPIAIKLKAYVELLYKRYRYTLLNWRLDKPISRTWSL